MAEKSSFTHRLIAILAANTANDGWLSRAQIAERLGHYRSDRPGTYALYSNERYALETLAEAGLIERREVKLESAARVEYRIRKAENQL